MVGHSSFGAEAPNRPFIRFLPLLDTPPFTRNAKYAEPFIGLQLLFRSYLFPISLQVQFLIPGKSSYPQQRKLPARHVAESFVGNVFRAPSEAYYATINGR